jgi:hypothetical protein
MVAIAAIERPYGRKSNQPQLRSKEQYFRRFRHRFSFGH